MAINVKNDLLKKDEKYVWHAMKGCNENGASLLITEADGAWITDADGNKYLDGMSGLWCVNVGYGRQELAEAAYEQLKTMPYVPMSNTHEPAINLAEKLNEWLEDDYVIFFSNSGSEANETAFKIARQYHQQNGEGGRYKFISRYRAYHGNSMGALAATGQAQRKFRYEPLGQGFIHVSPPDVYRSPYSGSLEAIGQAYADEIDRAITWEFNETVAGVIMEPIITGGGVIVPPENYLPRVKEICERHGVLLIIDEVICGFGRTGKKFGHMNYGIKPDIVTMAKGLTSAYLPLSATAVKRGIFERFKETEDYNRFRHVNTFGGNPSACALALKNLEIMENERLIERSAELGEKLANEMAILKEHPNVGDIRSKGLLMGIELVENKQTKKPASLKVVNQVIASCKDKGLIISKNGDTVAGFNNIITLSPPLSMTDDDFAFLVKTLKESFENI
ncbi:adenosylmethionine-8-amino-7-oxononanoate aminotransferase [Scopulibacillus daqui]|uniref:Adenosylmethionine-8-amino-7-oxononanoate aminotransferase n=1 Tax=Scopulibacillus daqui TaxID=1469162 RepID=A0ABS2Q1T2_9BACL|nr:aspartate aminotransferase family protein [Scopulibacillus daqui]MBM7646242.1 adenosylmethionine-8-amino-7-oxononanoate aminotransferase [Scopulibacillus daqui]